MPVSDENGVRIALPSSYDFVAHLLSGRRVGLPSGPITLETPSAEHDAVLGGLTDAGFTIMRDESASPTAAAAALRALTPATGDGTIDITVELQPGEQAVILMEQDGVYAWRTESHATGATALRTTVAAARTVTFQIDIHGETSSAAATRSLQSFLFGRLRTIVLKFLADEVAGAVTRFLDRNVHRGLVHIAGAALEDWVNVDNLQSVGLEAKTAPRLLLFVHGTFSSTRGSFGALTKFAWGESFLKSAMSHYDAVIGIDHATLVDEPTVNARALLTALEAVAWTSPPLIDVITFSRGGLVYRTLVEELLPGRTFKPRFGRSIYVAVPNAGTQLANPANWRELIDLYTNLGAALFRLLEAVTPPNVAAPVAIFAEAVSILGAFVKDLASAATDEKDAPGLASMNPSGRFIQALNRSGPNQPSVASTYYCYITSDFDTSAGTRPSEFPPALWSRLASGFVHRLMNAANDLVIDCGSVPKIDPDAGAFMKEVLDFGKNASVYHTNYFTRPEVVNALTRWLQLSPPDAAATIAAEPSSMAMPAAVDTDILVADSEASVADLHEAIVRQTPSYVVVQHQHEGAARHYVFPTEILLKRMSGGEQGSIKEVAGLHEWQTSQTISRENFRNVRGGDAGRTIVLSRGAPAGVVSEPLLVEDTNDFINLAHSVREPQSLGEQVIASRAMPTFLVPDAVEHPITAAEPETTPHLRALASIDDPVTVNKIATIDVAISPLGVAAAAGKAFDTADFFPTPARKLIVQVVPRQNFSSKADESRIEIDVSTLSEERHFYFEVMPTTVGEGEVWVIVRQEQAPLATLKLKCRIAAATSAAAAGVKAAAEGVMETTAERPAIDRLTIWDSESEGNLHFRFELDAPSIHKFESFDLAKPIGMTRIAYVEKIYKELESYWGTTAADAADFLANVRSFGMNLYDEIVPEALQSILWENRTVLRSIMIVSTEPFLPWELMHLHEPGEALPDEIIFLAQLGLVRWLYGTEAPLKLTVRNRKVRYVIPDYPEQFELPNTHTEQVYLEKEFEAVPVMPTLAEVRELLGTGGFDLLHFSCHGANDSNAIDAQVMLRGRIEGGKYFPALLNASIVRTYGKFGKDGSRPMIFVNACQVGGGRKSLTRLGGFASEFLIRGAGVFVAPLWSVRDLEASRFSVEFYKELRKGKTLSEAAALARAAARGQDATWIAYAVYGHPNATIEPVDATGSNV